MCVHVLLHTAWLPHEREASKLNGKARETEREKGILYLTTYVAYSYTIHYTIITQSKSVGYILKRVKFCVQYCHDLLPYDDDDDDYDNNTACSQRKWGFARLDSGS